MRVPREQAKRRLHTQRKRCEPRTSSRECCRHPADSNPPTREKTGNEAKGRKRARRALTASRSKGWDASAPTTKPKTFSAHEPKQKKARARQKSKVAGRSSAANRQRKLTSRRGSRRASRLVPASTGAEGGPCRERHRQQAQPREARPGSRPTRVPSEGRKQGASGEVKSRQRGEVCSH